ncbi:hypothetical protein AKJ09_11259 [Labilithrix luteola]|uniref:Uncharacterized protein n=1 Tax=Labilithrix luteola TaxID=1391654 RepID=A0A0K1QFN9_9BACT|nr:hypothetical protein AKJ09_11259 [Labilithrix luteola]
MLTAIAGLESLHCAPSRSTFEAPQDAGEPAMVIVEEAGVDAALPETDCAEENKLIYVLSSGDKALHRFDPMSLSFTRIGTIACPTTADTFSMAVDRKGIAWVEFTDGRIYNVDTKDAHCTETPFRGHQPGFSSFGMGFAKDDAGDAGASSETLFIEGEGLARIDTKTYELTLIGPAALGLAELTGTGNGLLYAFSVNSGRLVRLDKTTGAALQNYRTSAVDPNGAWAFAHWGGDFWLFTGHMTSAVTRYSPATDTSTVVVDDTGMLIVGAGSSTCAPVVPPR